jgi:uncharacterized membrane protein
VNITDDYDGPDELVLTVQERLNGTTEWSEELVKDFTYDEVTGSWETTVLPKVNVPPGSYDLRVTAVDLDAQYCPWLEYPSALDILNNVATTPVVHISPDKPVTTSTLAVEFDVRSSDVETPGLTYNFTWYRDGVHVPELVTDNVPSYLTSRDENWSVEVRAWDGDEMSLPGTAWVLLTNTPPAPKDAIPDPEMDEDTSDSEWVNLLNAFQDNDGDPLVWSLGSTPENITVEIDHDTGQVTFTPNPNWFGEEEVRFVASDGEFTTSQTVTVKVHSVNDLPTIATIDGFPPVSDPILYSLLQGQVLVIRYTLADVEGDEIQLDVSTNTVTLDEVAQTITFEAGNDAVGSFTFVFRIWDVVSPGQKIAQSFTIEVVNENDPMEEPTIGQPMSGAYYEVNESFDLVGYCDDPDIQWGQVLEFIWASDIEGDLGTGPSINVRLMKAGNHTITLTVKDPDFQKTTSILVHIEPRDDDDPLPDPDDPDTGPATNWTMVAGILIGVMVLIAVVFLVVGKRQTEAYEERMDAEDKEEEKRVALKRTHEAIKDLADEWEGDKAAGETKAKAAAAGWEAEEEGYEEIEMGTTEGALSMEASVTEEASDDVKKLFTGVAAAETERTDEEKEAMRIENEKRQYQNAIGRLPYGIPSKELADKDWVDLANSLATCEKKTVEGGKEVSQIDGRWYYSDREDTGTFLKEHGKKKEERPPKMPTTDREKLLAKLEERFILGEISEETYKELKKKYSG